MQVVNIPTAKGMIVHGGMRKRKPVMLWGPSGVGKSELVQQVADEHGGVLVDFRASQWEGIDFRGIPENYRIEGTGQLMTEWSMPGPLPYKGNPKFDEDGPPIFLFADEVNSGEPSTMAVLYQMFQDRRVGELILMDNVIIVAAGNREQDRGVVNRFPAPLANRMVHCELIADHRVWSAWAAKAGVPAVIIGFVNFRSELLHTFDPDAPAKVFATPRSWKFAAEVFEDDAIPADIKGPLMSGSIGEGPAVELMEFAKIMSEIRPIEEIIKDPTGVPVSERLDMQWAMATHVAGNMTKANADALHQFLARLEPEMVVMAWTLAINRDEDITDSNAFLYGYAPQYRGLFQN